MLSFLIGHQGKQHNHVGGLRESMIEDGAAGGGEDKDLHFVVAFGCLKRAKRCLSLTCNISI